jgi:nucleoside 2-deoxyribosyltransferase
MTNIYLAHPISGYGAQQILDYYANARHDLEDYYYILNPMTNKAYLRNEIELKPYGYDNPVATNHAIYGRDTWMVRQADIVYVDFTAASHISIGCCMELAIAHELGKHTIVSMENINIHRHAFVLEAADIVFPTSEEAIRYLITLWQGF